MMKNLAKLLYAGILLVMFISLVSAQTYTRKSVNVPKVSPTAITIDGQMNEAAWTTAGRADLITTSGFQIFTNKYYRAGLREPDYNELYARMLWARETLYVFVHIDEFVNDSTDLFWKGKWTGDQLFISLSNRLAVNMKGWYDGNVYAAPSGPYHFLVLGDKVTLNNADSTSVPKEYQRYPADTLKRIFKASDVARWATSINKTTGVWNIEMAIYNPHVNAGSRIAFNLGGSTGSTKSDVAHGDAYGYWTWQPSVVDSPYAQPAGVPIPSWGNDPGYYNLANADAWALLNFTPGQTDYNRKVVDIPKVDPTAIKVDGQMNESAWNTAAKANLITSSGFQIFTNKYYRAGLREPDYNELYARLLWAKETLYVFVHIDEFVNDSTDLFWKGKWTGDQLFVSLSNRLGTEMKGWYDGNVYAAPDGPYHFLVLGDKVTLNNADSTSVPKEYQRFAVDTLKRIFKASDIARWATSINKTTGVWNVEMAIYSPNANVGGRIGFNLGGSTGSTKSDANHGDAYGYWTWQPSVVDSPYAQPAGVPIPSWGNDPGYYNLATSLAWALGTFSASTGATSVESEDLDAVPRQFTLWQNYPNPFNPETKIRFGLPAQGNVTLTVFNILGQRVAVLAEGLHPAGTHEVHWNAARMGSGVYFYELKVDENIVSAKKMLLIR
ncbi:MAG TPA: hypothetical protein DCX46_12100 [Bacteroidetes bacterium]|nr:hypothetical protein [Bacteroidota bacterium]